MDKSTRQKWIKKHNSSLKNVYLRTGSQTQKILVVNTFQKCNTLDFKFNFGKLNNKKFPHMV